MPMDHQLGGIALINWQGRKVRKAQRGVALRTLVMGICIIAAAAIGFCEVIGWIPKVGLVSSLPAVLLLVAIGTQMATLVRAAVGWLLG